MKNIEIKAYCPDPIKVEEILMNNGARFEGIDHQIDTYFNAKSGRLKLREGNIENSLIAYHRNDQANAKKSDFELYHPSDSNQLKKNLLKTLGVLVVVDKERKIFFIDQVKFHIDSVKDLGEFMEIEVTDLEDVQSEAEMNKLCQFYIDLLEVKEEHLISNSYSDLILEKAN